MKFDTRYIVNTVISRHRSDRESSLPENKGIHGENPVSLCCREIDLFAETTGESVPPVNHFALLFPSATLVTDKEVQIHMSGCLRFSFGMTVGVILMGVDLDHDRLESLLA